jgi:hypothetical protein
MRRLLRESVQLVAAKSDRQRGAAHHKEPSTRGPVHGRVDGRRDEARKRLKFTDAK